MIADAARHVRYMVSLLGGGSSPCNTEPDMAKRPTPVVELPDNVKFYHWALDQLHVADEQALMTLGVALARVIERTAADLEPDFVALTKDLTAALTMEGNERIKALTRVNVKAVKYERWGEVYDGFLCLTTALRNVVDTGKGGTAYHTALVHLHQSLLKDRVVSTSALVLG
jgi:hypothetical protein